MGKPGAERGETDLGVMLQTLKPEMLQGEWFFGTVPLSTEVSAAATVREPEGLSVVVDRVEAERLDLDVSRPFCWITLRVHSSLEAVGLTHAVSAALTERGISCNVIAGAYHDHVLVPWARGEHALAALLALASNAAVSRGG